VLVDFDDHVTGVEAELVVPRVEVQGDGEDVHVQYSQPEPLESDVPEGLEGIVEDIAWPVDLVECECLGHGDVRTWESLVVVFGYTLQLRLESFSQGQTVCVFV
jgi:hypothetical protein